MVELSSAAAKEKNDPAARFRAPAREELFSLAAQPLAESFAAALPLRAARAGGASYSFGARYYSSSLGRFLSPDWSEDPDPVPYADLSNPQSLNLYAYVNNNPVTATDPDGHAASAQISPPGGSIYGTGYGACSLDGINASCDWASNFDSVTGCPNNFCEGLATDMQLSKTQYWEFVADGTGAASYMGFAMANGFNEINGMFMNNAAFNSYVLAQYSGAAQAQLASVRAGAAAAGAPAGAPAELNMNGALVSGGNVNFPIASTVVGQMHCGTFQRCANGIHFPRSEDGYVHRDASDPFGSVGGFLQHTWRDIILGNIAYWILPAINP